MKNESASYGKCVFCNKDFSKSAITRHLSTHLTQRLKEDRPGKSFLIKVETDPRWGKTPYFLHLWVDGKATMGDIDDFLRGIWLECCGHMSSFTNPKQKRRGGMFDFFEAQELLMKDKMKDYEKLMEEANGEVPQSKKVKDVLYKDLKLNYDYDFGSTTSLQLTVAGEYAVQPAEEIVLLSRNEPPEIICSKCGKAPATQMCTVCVYNTDAFFCDKCAKLHAETCPDFGDYSALPVVNSPRMGVCAYEGGTIDVERDVYR